MKPHSEDGQTPPSVGPYRTNYLPPLLLRTLLPHDRLHSSFSLDVEYEDSTVHDSDRIAVEAAAGGDAAVPHAGSDVDDLAAAAAADAVDKVAADAFAGTAVVAADVASSSFEMSSKQRTKNLWRHYRKNHLRSLLTWILSH